MYMLLDTVFHCFNLAGVSSCMLQGQVRVNSFVCRTCKLTSELGVVVAYRPTRGTAARCKVELADL